MEDHIDGDRENNSRENLRLVCPNCHSQIFTFCHRNVSSEGKRKISDNAKKVSSINNRLTGGRFKGRFSK